MDYAVRQAAGLCLVLFVSLFNLAAAAQDDDVLSPDLEAFLAEFGSAYSSPPQRHQGPVTFAVVLDGSSARSQEEHAFIEEIQGLAGTEFDLHFPDELRFSGDWQVQGVRTALDRALAHADVDFVLALGFMASIEAAGRGTLNKPVIAPYIVDAEVLGIPKIQGLSGVRNLVYLTSPNPVLRDLQFFQEMAGFKHVAVLASRHMLEAAPALESNTLELAQHLGFAVQVIPVDQSAKATLDALSDEVDAVYVLPLFQFDQTEFAVLVDGVNMRGLPSFTLQGVQEVESGVLATLSPAAETTRLARRVALYVQRILLGEAAERLPVDFPVGERLVINMATARRIGFYPDWTYLNEAELLNDVETDACLTLTLSEALERALEVNVDLAASERATQAGAQEIPEARSVLKPQVELSSRGLIIDKDLASALQPERQVTGSLKVRQVLYSDLALANLQISKRLQAAREYEYAGQRLDLMQLAADAYLNVLRAETFEQVQKDDLKVTREHLELARVRQEAGVANPGEVYRWESQLAQSRIGALEATSQRELAELQMKRVLNLPQESSVRLHPLSTDTEVIQFTGNLAQGYLNNPERLRDFVGYMVRDGLAVAPELQRIDAAIAAQERLVLANRRQYYAPTIAAEGELKHELADGGAGTGDSGLMGLLIPDAPDSSWTIGVQGSLPLYTGGSRKANRVQSSLTLEQLRLERIAAEEKLEQRIRSAMEKVRASWPTIRYAENASDAAQKNLGLVTDAYGRGVVDIIALLDAQSAALTARLGAAGAVYQFLIDLVQFERSIGSFAIFTDPADRASWLAGIQEYFESTGNASVD
jgi:outer membrane protein TolC/ABC-type uncharacterized transport system substrate-binding protein